MASDRILIIDDEPAICSGGRMVLEEQGYCTAVASCGWDGLEKIKQTTFDIVLLDIKLPGISGMEILKEIKPDQSGITVIMMTGHGTVNNAVEAMKNGAFDFITKPFSEGQLVQSVDKAVENRRLVQENRLLKKQLSAKYHFSTILGKNRRIAAVLEKIEKVAPLDSTVLLNGESGTGKELFANAIHTHSQRAANLFLAVDCSTLSSSLLESELFGHVKGAFTGADTGKQGIFETASNGSLFLDEISNLNIDIQGKLLRVLETGEYKPIGSSKIKKTGARIIAATNTDLEKMVSQEKFRSDLFYRLNVFPIKIPPLRRRRDDIPMLIYHFLTVFSRKTGKKINGFSDEALKLLVEFDWPGNVRQLKNVVERLVIMTDTEQVSQKCLMENFPMGNRVMDDHRVPHSIEELKAAKKRFLEENFSKIEKTFLQQALDTADGNITRAAKEVNMQRSNFSTLMKKHNLKASVSKKSQVAP
ncbi:MAG: sigma-54 dependent transcriptional regulator [Desulfobacteraceae bacterium]